MLAGNLSAGGSDWEGSVQVLERGPDNDGKAAQQPHDCRDETYLKQPVNPHGCILPRSHPVDNRELFGAYTLSGETKILVWNRKE
jgi:hypothetical protein